MPTNIRLYGKTHDTDPAPKSAATKQDEQDYFELETSYEISPSRSETNVHTVTIKDDQFVEIVFSDNSTWFGDQDTLKEIFPEIKLQGRSAKDAPALPPSLTSDDGTRSLVGDIVLKFVSVFVKKKVQSGIKKTAAKIENKPLQNRNGLFSLPGNFTLAAFNGFSRTIKSNDKQTAPVLLFIHGTASCTEDAFGKLPGSTVWDEMVKYYGDNIIAFEHRTLTEGPVQNAHDLIDKLPPGITYDVITHSRGGIVGELLMRFCESKTGFLPESLQLLKDEQRDDEVELIKKAVANAQKKKIRVGRFVRVACTARGTSLLSERTDIFLNTLINLINVSSTILEPIVGGLKYLVSETINSKNSFEELPGLEAQRPNSPLIKALNTYKEFDKDEKPVGFDNRLAVISGNGKFSLSLNGVKIMLTKFFFKWQQNDLVVDTVSMYQGAKREKPVQYFLDNGTDTNHFNYFLNKTTRDALHQALFAGTELLPTFKEIQGEDFAAAAAGRGILGLENGRLLPVLPKGKKPVVILLPGIMGSFLEQEDESIWINYWRFATGGLTRLSIADGDKIKAAGVIKTAYNDLVEYLSGKYDVLVFPFDWRLPLAKAGEELKDKILYLKNDVKIKTTISLVGHSMGGLVIRDLVINHADVWKELNNQQNFRTILLGTPWLGSFRIPHVLSGKDSIIKQLDLIDFAHNSTTLINMFSKFPGLLDLLPIHGNKDFGSEEIWDEFIKASGGVLEMIPEKMRTAFTGYSNKIKAGIDNINYTNIVYVAGKYKETIKDYRVEEGTLKFYATAEGDQSVTWESGIPAKINRGTSLYYTNASHGSLTKKSALFNGILDILQQGATASHEFSRVPISVSEGSRSFESKEEFEFVSTRANIETSLLGLGEFISNDETNTPILNISISNGDLMFAKYPVMIGHFVYDGIYNAEKVVNAYLDNALQQRHKLGLYPGPVGSSEFFKSYDENNDFKGSIIVGLGVSELLTPYQLTLTIEKAVAGYLLTHCKNEIQSSNRKQKLGLSTVLIGAGYTGMAIESACRAIMQGIINANGKVIAATALQDLYISELEFIELMEDKSISCFTSIKTLIQRNNDGMNLGWSDKSIKRNPGARKRLLTDNAGGWWQRLCVLGENECDPSAAPVKLSFSSSTNNARQEKKEIAGDLAPLEGMVDAISASNQWNYEKAKSLFELLIPSDFKENIKRNTDVIWVLDKYTASYPWELLQTGLKTEKPLCISAGMIRQLAISNFDVPIAVKNNNVIVIGDPDLEGLTRARQLPGAAREAREIYELFNRYNDRINIGPPLINAKSGQILTELFKQDYKIVHIAAHGFFDDSEKGETGIVIGKKKKSDDPVLLTPAYIKQLPATPELVFVNSCFLGKVSTYAEEYAANRNQLAGNIGTQLIKMGVKAVVVAGWEVDDAAALAFAKKFYEEMFDGKTLGNAMVEARKHVYNNFGHTNTWGAFQCYGQPEFNLNMGSPPGEPVCYDIPQQAENALEQLISKSEVAFYDPDDLMEELKGITAAISDAKFTECNVKEPEARAYHELNDYNTAISIYEEIVKSEKADFSISSLQSYYDIQIKKAMIDFYEAEETGTLDTKLFKETLTIIGTGISNFERLLGISETSERHSLIASAYKRKARVIIGVANDKAISMDSKNKKLAATEAINLSTLHYYSAYKKKKDSYSFSNWFSMKVIFELPKRGKWTAEYKEDSKKISEQVPASDIKTTLQQPASKKPGGIDLFWDLSQPTNILLCSFLLNPGPNTAGKLKDEFIRTWKRTGAKNKKSRQLDNIRLLLEFASFAKREDITSHLKKLAEDIGAIKKK